MRKATVKVLRLMASIEAVEATERLGRVVRVTRGRWKALKRRYRELPSSRRAAFKRGVLRLAEARRRDERARRKVQGEVQAKGTG